MHLAETLIHHVLAGLGVYELRWVRPSPPTILNVTLMRRFFCMKPLVFMCGRTVTYQGRGYDGVSEML
jgi:hypothetical protein